MLHEDRARAESFGGEAARYHRSRPRYPEALLDFLVDRPDLEVLDVGCGTGIAAGQIADRGARVLGVEVDPRMAELARSHGTTVEVAPFETWDPGGRSFDLVTAAQAWHWVDPVAGPVKSASVLRTGGRLAVFWNIGSHPAQLGRELAEVYRALAPGTDRDPDHTRHLEGIRACVDLEEPEVHSFRWSHEYTTEEWLDQLPTHSDHARLEEEQRRRLLEAVAGVIDRSGGRFTMSYRTELFCATRR